MPALRPGKARSERVLPAARASTLTLCSLYATLPDPLTDNQTVTMSHTDKIRDYLKGRSSSVSFS